MDIDGFGQLTREIQWRFLFQREKKIEKGTKKYFLLLYFTDWHDITEKC